MRCLGLIKNTYFQAVKKVKCANSCIGFFQTGKVTKNEICQKIVYISKSVKNIKLLPAEKVGNINLYQQTVLFKIVYDFTIEISLTNTINF